MTKPFREVLRDLWCNGSELAFEIDALMMQMRLDAGDDLEGIRPKDVELILEENPPRTWETVIFISRELLSYYKMLDSPMTLDQLTVALFCAFSLSRAEKAGVADLWTYNDAIIRILSRFDDEVLATQNLTMALNYIYERANETPKT